MLKIPDLPADAGARARNDNLTSARGLGDGDQAVDQRMLQYLLGAGRPVDDDAVDPLATTEPEVQSTIVLAGEAHSAIDDPALLEITGFHNHFGADRAAVAACADEVKLDPMVGSDLRLLRRSRPGSRGRRRRRRDRRTYPWHQRARPRRSSRQRRG